MNIRFEMTHISEIRQGDTIEHHGSLITVDGNHIRKCQFMGLSIYGDTYSLGNKLVKRAVILRAVPIRVAA